MARDRVVVLVSICCVLAPILGGVTVAGAESGSDVTATVSDDGPEPGEWSTFEPGRTDLGSDGPAQTSSQVLVTQSFGRLPDQPGWVTATRQFDLPSTVETLRTQLPESAENVETSGGFERVGERRYEWTGGSGSPSIRYSFAVNETGSVSGPEGADGRFLFVDTGDWALFRRPSLAGSLSVESVGGVTFQQRAEAGGTGAAGDVVVFLGEHDELQHSAHDQTFRLVVPETASLAESPEDIFSSMSDASDALRVGDRDESVFLVAAPTSVPWAVEGLQTGDADAYVTADERLDSASNTWLHEYVHTRQSFNLTSETRWFAEASATYYAALLTLEQDRIGFDAFQRTLGVGAVTRFDDVVLSDPGSWHGAANYRKGGLVTGELDRRIRVATDAGADLQAVVGELNGRARGVTGSEFVDVVRRTGGDGPASDANRYTTTTATPEMWDRSAHQAAFGRLPPRIEYSVASDGVRVGGPYRNRTIAPEALSLVPGERLTVPVRVTNTGGAAGEYNATARVDGRIVTTATGRIEAGEETTASLTVPFEATGNPTVSIGGRTLDVRVGEPASLSVTRLVANRSTARPGRPVELTVSVANPEDRPGERTLQVTAENDVLSTREVRLDAGERRNVTVSITFEEVGSYRVGVGDVGVSVTVEATADESGPGFGTAATVLALLVGSWLLVRRDR